MARVLLLAVAAALLSASFASCGKTAHSIVPGENGVPAANTSK